MADFFPKSIPGVIVISETARAIQQLRRRTGVDSSEWNDELLNILSRSFTYLSERLNAYDKALLEKIYLQPTVTAFAAEGVKMTVVQDCADCEALKCEKHREVKL